MPAPQMRDYARLNPIYLSIVVGREPVVLPHASRGGAARSAYSSARYGSPSDGASSWDRIAQMPCGIGVVKPNGDVEIIEFYETGEKIEWRRR